MTRPAGQDKYEALLQEALELLDQEQANGIILQLSSNGKGDYSADFAGNGADEEMALAFGHTLGASIAHEPSLGEVITKGIKLGIENALARNKSSKPVLVKNSPTKH